MSSRYQIKPWINSWDEAELVDKRVQTLTTWGSALGVAQSAASTIPFNLDYFITQLAQVFTPDITFSIPNGVGIYTGLNDVAEYLCLLRARPVTLGTPSKR